MHFPEKLMSQTLKMTKNLILGPILAYLALFFFSFISTTS